jgi:hypothetical protein
MFKTILLLLMMALNPPNDKPGILNNTNPYFLTAASLPSSSKDSEN